MFPRSFFTLIGLLVVCLLLIFDVSHIMRKPIKELDDFTITLTDTYLKNIYYRTDNKTKVLRIKAHFFEIRTVVVE